MQRANTLSEIDTILFKITYTMMLFLYLCYFVRSFVLLSMLLFVLTPYVMFSFVLPFGHFPLIKQLRLPTTKCEIIISIMIVWPPKGWLCITHPDFPKTHNPVLRSSANLPFKVGQTRFVILSAAGHLLIEKM